MLAVPLLAAASLGAAPLRASACNPAAARAAITSTRLTIPPAQSISSEPYRPSPSQVDGVICIRLPAGKTAMVVPLASGGTAGDIGWVVFVSGPTGYRVSLVRGGYKLGLVRAGSDLIETDPVYRKNDANCCPSGGFDHARWRWDGARYRVVRTWHNQSYGP
jgi:hypothetical protein